MNAGKVKCQSGEMGYVGIPARHEILPDVIYDARTSFGPWGYFCQACFEKLCVGLGEGKGQRYMQTPKGLVKVDTFDLRRQYEAPGRSGPLPSSANRGVTVEELAQLHERVRARVDNLLVRCRDEHGLTMRFPGLSFKSGMKSAGTAWYSTWVIDINDQLLVENPDEMIRDTVAHEVAHLVVYTLFGNRPKPHGFTWQCVMLDWFKVEPKRCHQFDTANVGKGKRTKVAIDIKGLFGGKL